MLLSYALIKIENCLCRGRYTQGKHRYYPVAGVTDDNDANVSSHRHDQGGTPIAGAFDG